jgi:arylsulfatase A-like enzyme
MSAFNRSSRRSFLQRAALASGAILAERSVEAGTAKPEVSKPNVLMICADQFRADFVGANGENPSVHTPNLDALAARGTNFRSAVCNQPLCSPSRASFLTGRYASQTGVWKLGLELDHSLPTIATTLKAQGYSTSFIGKWHVSANINATGQKQQGWIPPGPSRGGFDEWEGANVLEVVSHPDHGNYWDNGGTDIGFKDEYRVDFLCDRAVSFLKQKHEKPWLLFLSQLEPHQQNDVDNFVPPARYLGKYDDAFVPRDLRDLPGNWNSRLPGYYGCVQAIDDCVGRVMQTLTETQQLENTVVVFFSDHGCHFRTRMGEYKRTAHDAAIRVPLIFAGPGFDQSAESDDIVSLIDLAPTLLDAAHVPVPTQMQGKSLVPLLSSGEARRTWDQTAYIEISESYCGRALRTPEWTYCACDPAVRPNEDERGSKYIDFMLYQNGADPFQKVNLIGRREYKAVAERFRKELKRRMAAAGEPNADIVEQRYYV